MQTSNLASGLLAAQLAASQAPLAAGPSTGQATATATAAQDFEAVFLSQMLAPMFENLDTGGLFGGGHGESVYRSLMVEEYGKTLAKAGGIGLAAQVQREMLKLQEIQ